MPGLHLHTSVAVLSSIAAPTAMPAPPNMKRDTSQLLPAPAPGISTTSSSARTDPLDGSLGLFLVMIGLIMLFVLAVAIFFWRVHLHRRARIIAQDTERTVPLPTLLYGASEPRASRTSLKLKLPPSLRVRSPVKNKLKFFILKSTTVEAAPDVAQRNRISVGPPVLPRIVVSQCSPVIPSRNPFEAPAAPSTARTGGKTSRSSSSSTSSLSSNASETLHVPGAARQPLVSFASSKNAKRASSAGAKGKGKGFMRSNSRAGKENAPPRSLLMYDMSQVDAKGCVDHRAGVRVGGSADADAVYRRPARVALGPFAHKLV
ncbi:hypothetical protein BDW22DRAFT_1345473 [Trametopsis cervina]|nr:hypothetical protein BDW22DRAFT_1345473 [Trametopsis cervina]